jgi:outer membrane murein-binding lipoprotein Lpp
MRAIRVAALAVSALLLYGCETTRQQADTGFQPPKGNYRVIVMQPDVTAGLLTAGGISSRAKTGQMRRATVS